jgi:hypothetical protein
MLRIATIQGISENPGDGRILFEKAHNWFANVQPAGMETVGWYRTIEITASAVYIFKSQSARDVEKLLSYWREWSFDVHLGQDWLELLPLRGVRITKNDQSRFPFVAFLQNIQSWALDEPAFIERLRTWLDPSPQAPATTMGLYKVLGTHAPLIYVFSVEDHNQLEALCHQWQGFSYELAPAVDWTAAWRQHGVSCD